MIRRLKSSDKPVALGDVTPIKKSSEVGRTCSKIYLPPLRYVGRVVEHDKTLDHRPA